MEVRVIRTTCNISGCNISEFIENLETSIGMGHSGQLGYINALGDLIDYRKYQGVTPQVLQNFSVVEMLIRRARRCISKKMRIQWNSELDIDSSEKRGHWATIEDLQAVIPYHHILTITRRHWTVVVNIQVQSLQRIRHLQQDLSLLIYF